MPTLGDFLGGAQGGSPAAPQPGMGDPGFQERKQGWMQSLKELASDPVTSGMMIQLGMSMANPRPGENTAGTITRSIGDMMSFRGRVAAAEEERRLTEQKQAREQQRVDLESRRADLSAEDMGIRQQERQDRLGLDRERLGLEKERLKADKMRARQGGAKGGATSDFRWMVGKIMEENPGIGNAAAAEMARSILSKKNEEDQVATMAAKLMEQNPERAFNRQPELTPEQAVAQARRTIQAAGGDQAGLMEQGPKGGDSKENPMEVASEEEANSLPPGTWVRLNGRVGRVK